MQEEVKCMQDEVTSMRNKIEEYNRTINENLRFLKGLEKDLSASDKKQLYCDSSLRKCETHCNQLLMIPIKVANTYSRSKKV